MKPALKDIIDAQKKQIVQTDRTPILLFLSHFLKGVKYLEINHLININKLYKLAQARLESISQYVGRSFFLMLNSRLQYFFGGNSDMGDVHIYMDL